jgi:hypothetical protein
VPAVDDDLADREIHLASVRRFGERTRSR